MLRKLIIRLVLTASSTVISIIIFAITFNFILYISGTGKQPNYSSDNFLKNFVYSSEFIFWKKPICTTQPYNCDYEAEKYLTHNIKILKPNKQQDCNAFKRILFVGDSFTEEYFLTKNGKSYATIFSQRLANEEKICVIEMKLASAASGTDQQYAAITKYLDRLEPDVLIWQFYFNDYYDNVINAIYDVKNNNLQKRQTVLNMMFLAGFLNQKIPGLKNTSLGKHLLYLGERVDVFHNYPADKSYPYANTYNFNKVSTFLKNLETLSRDKHFEFYTFLMPLECDYSIETTCRQHWTNTQEFLRQILTTQSQYLGISKSNPNSSLTLVLGAQTASESSQLTDHSFMKTTVDKGEPGSRHLSDQGDYIVGQMLFDQYQKQSPN